MKKVLLFIITLLLCIPIVKGAEIKKPKLTKHEKVTIYLFWASWCPHCHDFIKYFSDKYEDYSDYFDIITYQLDSDYEINNQENNALLKAVREEVGNDSTGIPFIIVGDSYQTGFGSDGSNIIEEALNAYQNTKYVDIVKKVSDSNDLMGFSNTFEKTLAIVNGEDTEEEPISDVYTTGQNHSSNSLVDFIINLIKNLFLRLFNII